MSVSQFKRVLVLAPHTDDGELGAGGTIARLTRNGVELHYIAFSAAEDSVPPGFPRDVLRHEVRRATDQLRIPPENVRVLDYAVRSFTENRQRILDDMISLRSELAPDLVVCPSRSDLHQDHQVVAAEALRAFKRCTVLGYELIWNNICFNGQLSVELSEEDVSDKSRALQEYRSQEHRSYMTESFVRSMATVRGLQIDARFAEAFEVLKWVIH